MSVEKWLKNFEREMEQGHLGDPAAELIWRRLQMGACHHGNDCEDCELCGDDDPSPFPADAIKELNEKYGSWAIPVDLFDTEELERVATIQRGPGVPADK